jgi:hypothetical protein
VNPAQPQRMKSLGSMTMRLLSHQRVVFSARAQVSSLEIKTIEIPLGSLEIILRWPKARRESAKSSWEKL